MRYWLMQLARRSGSSSSTSARSPPHGAQSTGRGIDILLHQHGVSDRVAAKRPRLEEDARSRAIQVFLDITKVYFAKETVVMQMMDDHNVATDAFVPKSTGTI